MRVKCPHCDREAEFEGNEFRPFCSERCKLLDLAAILDRITRGENAATVARDPRLARIQQALEALRDPHGGRAERIQLIFSLDYDAAWEKPLPG